MRYYIFILLLTTFTLTTCSPSNSPEVNSEVDSWLHYYNNTFVEMLYPSSLAEWEANTHIEEGDTVTSQRVQQTNEAYAAFIGSTEVIDQVNRFLNASIQLNSLQRKQLERILYQAASRPMTQEEAVKKLISVENEQTNHLFGHDYRLEGRSVSTNEIDSLLRTEINTNDRLEIWKTSKEVGKKLRPGLVNLVSLRNQVVQGLGYADYFSYQVSEYGMKASDMMELTGQLVADIWPLYQQLHTYLRYTLAEKYSEPVPDMLPAHWLPNRWGQDWSPTVKVEGVSFDEKLEAKGAKWVVPQAERFYVSLGFDSLPRSFYEKSSLYPLPPNTPYKKNNHASAWHLNRKDDIRCLMSIVPTMEWYETAHHELGHIYYYISYSNPEVPYVLRRGANRAFHEAIGSLMGFAAMQQPFLEEVGLVSGQESDQNQTLLKEALNYVVFIPWSAGVMTRYEHALYADHLPDDQYNTYWWKLKRAFQGIVPPENRDESFGDAATKTHIINDPAQYYDYALSYALLFHFHRHIAQDLLHQPPHATNYYGSKKVGNFLKELMKPGLTRDWRELLHDTMGQELDGSAMVAYFKPLLDYLEEINEGRTHTLPDHPPSIVAEIE